VQAKLTKTLSKNSTYCFKAKVLLSRNAGYSINNIGVLFSNKAISYSYLKTPTNPTIVFTEVINNKDGWETLCKSFVAKGDESYLSIGRFNSVNNITVFQQNPRKRSQLDINRSAYYLFDDLQLYQVDSSSMCGCSSEEIKVSVDLKTPNFEEMDPEITSDRFILSNILFDFDKTNIKNSFKTELNIMLDYLKRNNSIDAIIHGYTDNDGTEQYNIKLSKERAKTIALWLIENGIRKDRVSYEGHGSSNPIVDNNSEKNREVNRRVEVQLLR
jgi:outer membrane protein OmpA-like peptidoglycan-associated protein